MYKEQDKQQSFFGNMLYEQIVPKEHFLRKLSGIVDFSFVNEMCKDLYSSDNGRGCWEPQIIFKALFLQFLYDLSDYKIEEEINDRLSFKWFLRLDADENAPDHSTLSRFRDRLGAERFTQIFNKIVDVARSHKLVSDKLHIVDATHVQAKVDIFKLKKTKKKDNPDDYVDKNTPDPDARFGRKTKSKPFYGYKQHIRMDAESEIVVEQHITPGNAADKKQLEKLLPKSRGPDVLTADKGYDSRQNHELLSERKVRNGIIPRKHKKSYNFAKRVSRVARIYRAFIEHKFAELKRWHSLKHARYWGLHKVTIQCLLASVVVNCKRMVTLLSSLTAPPRIMLRAVTVK